MSRPLLLVGVAFLGVAGAVWASASTYYGATAIAQPAASKAQSPQQVAHPARIQADAAKRKQREELRRTMARQEAERIAREEARERAEDQRRQSQDYAIVEPAYRIVEPAYTILPPEYGPAPLPRVSAARPVSESNQAKPNASESLPKGDRVVVRYGYNAPVPAIVKPEAPRKRAKAVGCIDTTDAFADCARRNRRQRHDGNVPTRSQNPAPAGAIDPQSGTYLPSTGDGGYVDPRNGTYYAPAGPNGVINTRTGQFVPVAP